MDRRDFLKTLAVTGAVVTVQRSEAMDILAQKLTNAGGGKVDLVAVMGGEPETMFRRAITEMGGMKQFIKPGQKVLMLGSGNVGLVVSFQLLQAGCEVVGLVDAAPRVGGYGVHAAKIARCGVPFYLSHTIVKAEGTDCVTGVTIAQVDKNFRFVEGSEKHFDVDTICLAVGLSPMSQLLKMAGCKMEDNPKRGGLVPICDEFGATSIPGIFVAGDVSGIEEASSAMIGGRIAGITAAQYLGFID